MLLMASSLCVWHQNLHRFADELLRGVSELSKETRIGIDDSALMIDHDHPVRRGIEHRTKIERRA
jgi:hypothetical protein